MVTTNGRPGRRGGGRVREVDQVAIDRRCVDAGARHQPALMPTRLKECAMRGTSSFVRKRSVGPDADQCDRFRVAGQQGPGQVPNIHADAGRVAMCRRGIERHAESRLSAPRHLHLRVHLRQDSGPGPARPPDVTYRIGLAALRETRPRSMESACARRRDPYLGHRRYPPGLASHRPLHRRPRRADPRGRWGADRASTRADVPRPTSDRPSDGFPDRRRCRSSRLRKAAYLEARGQIVAQTEDHCRVPPGWCEWILRQPC